MSNPTMWFEVSGKDQQALKGFYSELFGWQLTDSEQMPYSMIAPGEGGGIPGGIGEAPEDYPGHVTFYVQTDDLDSKLSQVDSLGGGRMMGPIDLPGGGRIALFTDPEGHVIGLMTQMDGANGGTAGQPTVHFEVLGSDREALKSFYTELFGWSTNEIESARGDTYSLVEAQDDGIAGGIGTAPEGTEGHVTFYVGVEDLDAALSKAESLGGSRLSDPMDIPTGQIAHFSDPEGHMIGLASSNEESS